VDPDQESRALKTSKANILNIDKQALRILEKDIDRQRLITLDKNTLIGLRKRIRVRKRLLSENKPHPRSNRPHTLLRLEKFRPVL